MREFLKSDSPERAEVEARLLETFSGFQKRFVENSLLDGTAEVGDDGKLYVRVGSNLFVDTGELEHVRINERSRAIDQRKVDNRYKQVFDQLIQTLYHLDKASSAITPQPYDSVEERMLHHNVNEQSKEVGKLLYYIADYLGITDDFSLVRYLGLDGADAIAYQTLFNKYRGKNE